MISKGIPSITTEDIKKLECEPQIASYYLGINKIPCVINSPLRKDNKPSFAIYSPNNVEVNYIDFSTGDRGSIYTLLSKMWNISTKKVLVRIIKDLDKFSNPTLAKGKRKVSNIVNTSKSTLSCKIREWKDYDIKYWESYGVPLKWLKYANVYPISHKIIIKDGQKYIYGADKYAYAFAEFKDGKTTLKIYQPYNKKGYKWTNKHDKSVISLWTKVPEKGDKICICSSLKDALCLWANTGIPALAIQGEGYDISKTAVDELKRRFKQQYILLDNDGTGIKNAIKLAESTGFTNIVLPNINGAKDISDLYLSLQNKKKFIDIVKGLFWETLN